MPEILNEPDLGAMVPPASVDNPAEAMGNVCKMSSQERKIHGKKLKNRVKKTFTTQQMVKSYAELYRTVLDSSGCVRIQFGWKAWKTYFR